MNAAPGAPTVSQMSKEIETSRATVINYLHYLKNARLINLLFSTNTNGQLQKPDQVYLQNTNLLQIVAPDNINNSNLRLTFFYNQVGYNHKLSSASDSDFKINDQYSFTVGGKYTQAEGDNRFAAADMIEIGEGNVIPLWLFGFLY